jgi:hypothetical protein
VIAGWIPALILALAGWMYSVGLSQLQPTHEAFEAAGRWRDLLVQTGACQALATLALFFGLRRARPAWLAAWLGLAFWIGAAQGDHGWWLTTAPAAAMANLLVALGLALVWGGAPVFGLGCALVLAWLGQSALAINLLVASVGYLRTRSTLWCVPVLVGFGLWKGGLHGIELLLSYWWAWLLPWALRDAAEDRLLRSLLFWELASWSTRAMPIGAAGALFGIWAGTGLTDRWQSPSWRRAVTLLALLLSWQALKPAEEWFNRRLLIGAQKAHIQLGAICQAQTLSWWVEHRGPAFGFDSSDLALADWWRSQSGKVLVLTPQAPAELREVTLVLQALAHPDAASPLGWDAEDLSAAAASIRGGNTAEGCGADYLILRGPHAQPGGAKNLLSAGSSSVYAVAAAGPQGTPPICLASQAPAPGASWSLILSDSDPHLAHWVETGTRTPEALSMRLRGPHVRVSVPSHPGSYSLVWQSGTTALGPYPLDRERCLQSLRMTLTVPEALPSRSLVPIGIDLIQNGPCPLDLGAERGLQLQTWGPRELTALAAPVQPVEGRLDPGKVLHLTLYLATPELEGDCPLEIRLVKRDGTPTPLQRTTLHTWRRWPPIAF